MNLGIPELVVILMILLLVFGGSRLPQIGESLGRTVRNFKRGVDDEESIKVEPASPPAETARANTALKAPPTPGAVPSAERDIADAELVEKKG